VPISGPHCASDSPTTARAAQLQGVKLDEPNVTVGELIRALRQMR